MGRRLRPNFAWYGDMTLVRHLWGCLGTGGTGIDVIFHEDTLSGRMACRPLADARAGLVGSRRRSGRTAPCLKPCERYEYMKN